MDKSNIKLTTAEIATLWKTYIQNKAVRVFTNIFFNIFKMMKSNQLLKGYRQHFGNNVR